MNGASEVSSLSREQSDASNNEPSDHKQGTSENLATSSPAAAAAVGDEPPTSSDVIQKKNKKKTVVTIDPNAKPASWRNTQSFHSVTSSTGSNGNGIGATNPSSTCAGTGAIIAGGSSGNSSTYAAQAKLPRLPIPTLEETLDKFPRVVQALLTPSQLQETRRLCDEFLQNDGPPLQHALMEYEKQGVEAGLLGSYVEEFWNESYLAVDGSVVLNLNPFFVLESGPDPKTAKDQLARAASLCFASVKLASLLKHETLRPDIFKGVPLCMDQFKVLFGASRQPGYNNGGGGDGSASATGGNSRSLDDDSNGGTNSDNTTTTTTTIMDDVHVYENSIHVAVLCKNQFYFFPALWPDSGHVAVDQSDIHDILKAIVDHAESNNNNNSEGNNAMVDTSKMALGVLTALPRGEWAVARQELLQTPVNKQSLHVIDSALFVLVLDDFCPADIHETSANMLHGTNILVEKPVVKKQEYTNNGAGGSGSNSVNNNNGGNKISSENGNNSSNSNISNINNGGLVDFVQCGTCLNRWYDKLQLIVCKDGTAGVNFEHAAIDGHTALRFVSDIFAETVISFAKTITQLVHGADTIPHVIDAVIERAATTMGEDGYPLMDCQPKKLKFELSDAMLERIYFAETALCDQMVGNDTHVLEFKDYGKLLIVGNKLSPDSVVQMSILLAYYKLYGKVVCQYEPVLTKSFYHGRTEAMRSATSEAKELCEIWCNKQSTGAQKLQALRNTCKEHSRLVQESANGKGVDRHLFALKCLSDRMNRPTPAFFEGVAWKKLNHTILSTSNCGNPSLKSFGFGPVAQDGFGVGYIIKDNGITYSVASKHRQTARYVHTIHTVLKELQALMKPLSAVLVKQRSYASPHLHHALPSPNGRPDVGKLSSFSAYDDAYGENDFKLPPSAVVAKGKRPSTAASRDKSRYFAIVKEQVEEVDLVGVGFGVHGHADETDFGAL